MGRSQVDGATLFSVVTSGRRGAMGLSWSAGKSTWTRERSLLWWWQNTETSCTERLWSLLPWRYSKPSWVLSCATYGREPALAGGWTRWSPEVPSAPVILWFPSFSYIFHFTPGIYSVCYSLWKYQGSEATSKGDGKERKINRNW